MKSRPFRQESSISVTALYHHSTPTCQVLTAKRLHAAKIIISYHAYFSFQVPPQGKRLCLIASCSVALNTFSVMYRELIRPEKGCFAEGTAVLSQYRPVS